MRPVDPPDDIADRTDGMAITIEFTAPEGLEDEVESVKGIAHLGESEDGERGIAAIELMYALTAEEFRTLKRAPYISLLVHADHLHPVSLFPSFGPPQEVGDDEGADVVELPHGDNG